MKKAKEPDKLSQDAAAARAAGMTYGKWKGLQYEQAQKKPVVKTEKKLPLGWAFCTNCGEPFMQKKGSELCGAECQRQYWKKKNSQNRRAEYHREYYRNKLEAQGIDTSEEREGTKKPVLQYDKDMNLIARYGSMKEAADKLKADPSSIGKVCKGKTKTAYGYIWRYENESKT